MAEENAPTTGTLDLQKKLGPFPVWVWAALVLGIVVLYIMWRNRSQSQSSGTNAMTDTGLTSAAQIPQFVNQTYTNSSPPSSSTTPVTSQPNPHAGVTAQGILAQNQTVASWAASHGVPVGAVQSSGSHVWTFAPTNNPTEGVTGQTVLNGITAAQWASQIGVPVGSVFVSGNHAWTFAPRNS